MEYIITVRATRKGFFMGFFNFNNYAVEFSTVIEADSAKQAADQVVKELKENLPEEVERVEIVEVTKI